MPAGALARYLAGNTTMPCFSSRSWLSWRVQLLAVVGLVLLGGCQTADPLGAATQGGVREGMTLPEVRSLLGSPASYEQAPSGRSVEVYEATRSIFGKYGVRDREEALEIRQFSVRYGTDGKVAKTLFHRGVLEGFTMLYTRSVGPSISPEQMAQVKAGRSTRADVEKLLGPPSTARLDADAGLRLEWIYDALEVANATAPARILRVLEITVDEQNLVVASKAIDRVFPSWRR